MSLQLAFAFAGVVALAAVLARAGGASRLRCAAASLPAGADLEALIDRLGVPALLCIEDGLLAGHWIETGRRGGYHLALDCDAESADLVLAENFQPR